MSDGESKVAVTMVRGAPATRYEGGTAGKVLQLAAGDEVTVHEEQSGAGAPAPATSFRIEHLLSTTSSGQACVYLVRDPAGAAFALKVYFAERDAKVRPSEQLLARYAALKHPNLVSVRAHGYGADGIEGAYDWELLELLEPLPKPADPESGEIWVENVLAPALSSAVNALVSANLVHCDIKPANLMQRPSTGEIVLVDIGSLKGVNSETKESVTTLVATTSAYAAPELLRKHVNEKTDAFSIGMTLYELARPGSLSSPRDKEVVARISRGQPVLDQLGSAPRLCDLVNGLTRGDLTARWGCEEFRQWVSGKQVVAPAPEITLPVIKWRKQQISTVPALLQVMADEAAFWSMCEDEGDLPHTLRQWVHTLHDETVGAALSRLVKRCLADGEPALGVTAIRRVLVPDGPFSVKGRQFGGTPAGAVDAIRAAGAVPADVEVALRLWGHTEKAGPGARVLFRLVLARGAEGSRVELHTGRLASLKGWEGAKLLRQLREVVGPISREETAAAARTVLSLVPVGTSASGWEHDLALAALLNPNGAEYPATWKVWEAACAFAGGAIVAGEFVLNSDVRALAPETIRSILDWEPGKRWLERLCPEVEQLDDEEEAVQAILWASGRRWLVYDGGVLRQRSDLALVAPSNSMTRWISQDRSHSSRLLAWVAAIEPELNEVLPAPDERLAANRLLWRLGATACATIGIVVYLEESLQQFPLCDALELLQDKSVRAWLAWRSEQWTVALADSDTNLASHLVLWALGESGVQLSTRTITALDLSVRLSAAESLELIRSRTGREWLRRSGVELTDDDYVELHRVAWLSGSTWLCVSSLGSGMTVIAREAFKVAPLDTVEKLWTNWNLLARHWLIWASRRGGARSSVPSSWKGDLSSQYPVTPLSQECRKDLDNARTLTSLANTLDGNVFLTATKGNVSWRHTRRPTLREMADSQSYLEMYGRFLGSSGKMKELANQLSNIPESETVGVTPPRWFLSASRLRESDIYEITEWRHRQDYRSFPLGLEEINRAGPMWGATNFLIALGIVGVASGAFFDFYATYYLLQRGLSNWDASCLLAVLILSIVGVTYFSYSVFYKRVSLDDIAFFGLLGRVPLMFGSWIADGWSLRDVPDDGMKYLVFSFLTWLACALYNLGETWLREQARSRTKRAMELAGRLADEIRPWVEVPGDFDQQRKWWPLDDG